MWRYPYPAEIIIGLVSTPVAVGNRVLVCGAEGTGKNFSVCLEMKASGGGISCREVYRSTELQLNNYNTAAIYKDAVFGFGADSEGGFIHCTEFADGRLLWKKSGEDWTKDQQLIIADGLIYAVTKNEELVMAEASREGWQELGRMKLNMDLGRPQHPTIANGRMYIRGNQWVACYQIAEATGE
jgi:hypothetical protein